MADSSGRPNRRARRSFTPEEVQRLIEIKRYREQQQRERFRQSSTYKFYNVFVLCCVFVMAELLMAYAGPVSYIEFNIQSVKPTFGKHWITEKPVITSIEMNLQGGGSIELITQAMVQLPEQGDALWIGCDYLLGKPIKASMNGGIDNYRLLSASPILIIASMCLLITFVAYYNHLNQMTYSLKALAFFNLMTLVGVFCL